jgi:hypothetical protein
MQFKAAENRVPALYLFNNCTISQAVSHFQGESEGKKPLET